MWASLTTFCLAIVMRTDNFRALRGAGMTAKSDLYQQRAAEFETLARETKDPAAKASYEQLAQSYRQLALHLAGASFAKRQSPPNK
jgi:hypothetical protein